MALYFVERIKSDNNAHSNTLVGYTVQYNIAWIHIDMLGIYWLLQMGISEFMAIIDILFEFLKN